MRRLVNKDNAAGADSDYPYGRNVDKTATTPGTKLNEEMFGDAIQFFEKLIDESGIIANELPDNEYSGWQLWDALKIAIQNQLLVKKSIVKDAGDSNTLELDGDEESPQSLGWYGTNESGAKGWQRPITGSVEVDSSYFRFENWSDYTFVFDNAGSQNKTINYTLIGNILFLNFTLNVDFDVTGSDLSDTGDIYIKLPPVLGDYTVRVDENFNARIADETPSAPANFIIGQTLIDTQTSQGCGLDEVHFNAILVGAAANRTLLVRGQIWIELDV